MAQGNNLHRGAANLHKMLRAPADFPLKAGGPCASELKKANLPSLSSHVYHVLLDIDPHQMIEEDYKHKHKQLFCWRMLKQIAQVDLATFAAHNKPPTAAPEQ